MSMIKIITFWPNPPLGNKKFLCPSTLVPYSKYLYFLISAFLVYLTGPNKYFSRVMLSLRFELNSPANICLSSRRLEDVLKICLEDVFNTSSA